MHLFILHIIVVCNVDELNTICFEGCAGVQSGVYKIEFAILEQSSNSDIII
jgi:hypothetical protein